MNPIQTDEVLEPAALTGWRLVLRGLARDSHLKVLLALLQRELNIDGPALKALLRHAPQPLWPIADRARARKVQATLAGLGCGTSLEEVVRFPEMPMVVTPAQEEAVSARLRTLEDGLGAVTLVRCEAPGIIAAALSLDINSVARQLGEGHELFRLDGRHLLLVAPVDRRGGVMDLRYRLQRELSRWLVGERGWQLGIALHPADGEALADLLGAAWRRLEQAAPMVGAAEKAEASAGDMPLSVLDMVRGARFSELQALPVEQLAACLWSLDPPAREAIVARLWLQGDATSQLLEMLAAPPQPLPVNDAPLARWRSDSRVQVALQQRRSRQHRLMALVERAEQLPALPQLVSQLLDMSLDANATTAGLADLIQPDPGLTTRLLSLVNSAYFGFHREITSVKHAVVILGVDEIARLATLLATARLFCVDDPRCGFTAVTLWKHANAVAGIARDLAGQIPDVSPGTAFTAGLLHDIGRCFLLQNCAADYAEVCREAREQNLPLQAVEEDRLGMDHAAIGARLAQSWNLPGELSAAVGWHHQPQRAGEHQVLAALVGLADSLHHRILRPDGPDGVLTVGHQRALEQRFGDLMPDSIAMLADEISDTVARQAELGAMAA